MTGFPYDVKIKSDNLVHFSNFLLSSQAVRRLGSAATDLAWVAAGRFDGFWEPRLGAWDMCAGTVLVREAGGTVTNYVGGKFSIYEKEILASNGAIHPAMMEVLTRTQIATGA
ncbi:Inositol-1-monophosphatase [compost metagenome]